MSEVKTLNINEIFYSIQGESRFIGYPCVFIRLAGCNLRCKWCDTPYARKGGSPLNFSEIDEKISVYNCRLVMVTGGEPLHQEHTLSFMDFLLEKGYRILLETNGSFSLEDVNRNIIKIVDVKTPSSGEEKSFNLQNVKYLTQNDELNFVIVDENDFKWSVDFIRKNDLENFKYINFTPAYGQLDDERLAEWILNEDLKCIRFGVQLHKIIWGDKRGV